MVIHSIFYFGTSNLENASGRELKPEMMMMRMILRWENAQFKRGVRQKKEKQQDVIKKVAALLISKIDANGSKS
jgi:hypothetical protein